MSTGSHSSVPQTEHRGGFFDALVGWVADWGGLAIDAITGLGDVTIFSWRTLGWLLFRRPKRETLMPVLYQVGVLSLPVVALTGMFIGIILAVQSYYQFHQLHMETRLGAIINMTLARELGPVLAATMLAGRVGCAMAAELGTMRVTEQIDALSSMGANPIHYLVVPRFLAFVLLIPTLTMMAVFMGVVGGYFYSVVILGIDKHHYLYNAQQFVGNYDLFCGVFKSLFFAVAISLISCYQGFHCRAGAEGVGRAATSAFVQSFAIILGLDLLLGICLDSFYFLFWPDGHATL
jgi:phospholipid/cholesterol/gamma-HCH transport system permease protein